MILSDTDAGEFAYQAEPIDQMSSTVTPNRYELKVGSLYPYFDRYGHSVRMVLFFNGMTNHLYIGHRDAELAREECEQINEGRVTVTCQQRADGLYVTWRFGLLTPIEVPVNEKMLGSDKVSLVPGSSVIDGTAIQVHVVDSRSGILCVAREFVMEAPSTRVLYGAMSRYRAELVREEGGSEVVALAPVSIEQHETIIPSWELNASV